MRVLALLTDAYGAHGGIAQYNRDLMRALVAMPEVEEVVALPRNVSYALEDLPGNLRYHPEAAAGRLRYVLTAIGLVRERFDLVVCGHINLLPIAALVNLKFRAPMALLVYGIDVWKPHSSRLVRRLLGKVSAFWSISEFTRDRMIAWSGLPKEKFTILPNAIHLERYGPGPKNPALEARYGLSGCKVIMMLGRLSASERYKGVDEVLEAMPRLLEREPTLKFLVAGDGDDRPRLEDKARKLGLADRVVFAGFVAEGEKADVFRLADAFVMPGRGEGFGFVFLEALACGVPVVGSAIDGSREALRQGLLGRLANPDDPDDIIDSVLSLLGARQPPAKGLEYFSFSAFAARTAKAAAELVAGNGA